MTMQSTTDETTSLHDALALLGDWEDELEWLTTPTTLSPPPSPRSYKRSRRKPQGPTAYRRRRDAQETKRADLELQVNALARLLQSEQTRILQRLTTTNASPLIQEYKAMIQRQKRQRIAAETTNKQLHNLVTTHQDIGHRISKLTRKAMILAEVGGLLHSTDRVASLATYTGPIISIPQHIRYLDCRMDEARMILSSDVFKESGGNDFQRVSVRDLGGAGLQVEVAVSRIVPFSVNAVARVLWSHLTHTGHHGRSTDLQPTHESSDLVCTTFVSEPTSHEEPTCNHGQAISGTTHGQTAVRNYGTASDGSWIFMSRISAGIFEEDGRAKGELQGDGWFQIEPLTRKGSVSTPQVVRIKWCRRVTGRPEDFDSINPHERARWIHSVVMGPMRSHWEKSLQRNIQDLENRLLPSM